MGYDTIAFETRDHVGWITLNRPEAGNAISIQMAREIQQVSHRINQDEDIRAVVITGSGAKAFCLGEDLDELSATFHTDSLPSSVMADALPHDSVPVMIASIECPVTAAINGDAIGMGLALALACDIRIASDEAKFCVPDVGRGYFMSTGITQLLPRIVGRGKAMELMLTSDTIDAPEALRIGLVHRVVPPDQVHAEAEKVATQIASGAPLALRYVKETVNKGMDLTLEQGLRLECDLYMILQTTKDRVEGIRAFREKRQPHFTGE
jgi:enoyl-CoA hydratase/carnithine racemase